MQSFQCGGPLEPETLITSYRLFDQNLLKLRHVGTRRFSPKVVHDRIRRVKLSPTPPSASLQSLLPCLAIAVGLLSPAQGRSLRPPPTSHRSIPEATAFAVQGLSSRAFRSRASLLGSPQVGVPLPTAQVVDALVQRGQGEHFAMQRSRSFRAEPPAGALDGGRIWRYLGHATRRAVLLVARKTVK